MKLQTQPVIIIDDEEPMRLAMQQWLELADLQVHSFATGAEALAMIDSTFAGVVVTDIRMDPMDGLDLMRLVHRVDTRIPVILITAHGDIPMAVSAIRDGAYDFLEKPFEPEILLETIRRALEQRTLVLENRCLRRRLQESSAIESRLLGTSPVMQFLREEVRDLGSTDASVFLFGETGTGKELTARCLHEASERADQEFVVINCGAIPEGLFESELFGHEPGAFTGAVGRRIGKFERADGGTLFLDEINNMPLSLQAKVLRVLQEKEIERLGGTRPLPIDIRLISATNVDPEQACTTGALRKDLYYRLNVARISMPPLRARGRDIILLFDYFVRQAQDRYSREAEPLSTTDITTLMAHSWPGNVRELRNLAERFVLSSHRMVNKIAWLLDQSSGGDTMPEHQSLASQMALFERCVLEQSLQKHEGNISEVLAELDLPRRTLNQKMQNHGLSRKDYLAEASERENSP